VETDDTITVSIQMNDTLRAELYQASSHHAVKFRMTDLAIGGNYVLVEVVLSQLLNNRAFRYRRLSVPLTVHDRAVACCAGSHCCSNSARVR
jgi:hypothetical protein